MRIVVIGGGIAGLASAIALREQGWEVEVHERADAPRTEGHGFLVMPNGLAALRALGLPPEQLPGASFDHALGYHVDPSAQTAKQLILDVALPPSRVMRREALVAALLAAIPPGCVRFGRPFVRFEMDRGRAVRALFADGSAAQADLFVAADGARSVARAQLFPDARLADVRAMDLVSRAHHPELEAAMRGTILKLSRPGWSVGIFASGQGMVVWHLQGIASTWDLSDPSAASRARFAHRHLKDWPEPIPELLANTDFARSHVWPLTDLDPLPAFHSGNVVLVGDAAHPLLPASAQGVSAALEDALALGADLQAHPLDEALATYSHRRLTAVVPALEQGRHILDAFLDTERPVPALIRHTTPSSDY